MSRASSSCIAASCGSDSTDMVALRKRSAPLKRVELLKDLLSCELSAIKAEIFCGYKKVSKKSFKKNKKSFQKKIRLIPPRFRLFPPRFRVKTPRFKMVSDRLKLFQTVLLVFNRLRNLSKTPQQSLQCKLPICKSV